MKTVVKPSTALLSCVVSTLFLISCSHPIVIVGDGDVTSASGERDCYLEDFLAGKNNCSKNYVLQDYSETYYADPREGWQFDQWISCREVVDNICSFNVPVDTVQQFWGETMPPLQAVFTRDDVGESFFNSMNSNEWTLVPTTDLPRFEPHRGMAVDSTGGRLFLFGSETHNETIPDNAVHIFDADTLAWTASYAPEPVTDYLIDGDFWTTTVNGNPWAAHTFDNIAYIPDKNQLLVMTAPEHNTPGMRAVGTSYVAKQTWLFDISTNSWQFLMDAGTPLDNYSWGLWAKGLVYDPNLKKVIGSGRDKTFMFDPVTQTWSNVGSNDDGHDIHATADYNHVTGQSFLFGAVNTLPNHITTYDPVLSQWQQVLTTGVTPVDADGAQIAVDTVNDVIVYVSVMEDQYSYTNPSGASQTLILDLHSMEWTIPDLSFTPLNFGFGFAMGYLEKYNVSLYLTQRYEEGTGPVPELWAFRYEPTAADAF